MKKRLLLMIELTAALMLLIGSMSAVGHIFPGDKLAYVIGNYEFLGTRDITVLDLRTRQSINLGAGMGFSSNTFSWSADGRLAFLSTGATGENFGVYVWDGHKLTDFAYRRGDDRTFAWTDNGRLTFVSARNGNWAIYLWDGVSLTNVLQSPYQQQTFLYAWWTP